MNINKEEFRTKSSSGFKYHFPKTNYTGGTSIVHPYDRQYFTGILQPNGDKVYDGEIYKGFLVFDTTDELGAFCFRFVCPDGNEYSSKEVLESDEIPTERGFWSRQKMFNDIYSYLLERGAAEDDAINCAQMQILLKKEGIKSRLPKWDQKNSVGSQAIIWEGDEKYYSHLYYMSRTPESEEDCYVVKEEFYRKLWDLSC